MDNKPIKLLFSGDLAPLLPDDELNSPHFTGIMDLLSETDLHITNLECPLTESEQKIPKTGPHLKASPENIAILRQAKVSVACLANNHILDYGEQGVEETAITCEKNRIETIGIINRKSSKKPFIIKEIKNKKIGILNYCEHEFSVREGCDISANGYDPVKAFYDITSLKNSVDYIFVVYHGGNEYFELPPPYLVKSFRYLADVGADVVIGHHTHVMSGYELYNNKNLIYSLGNFFFPFENEPEAWYRGLLAKIIIDEKIEVQLVPVLQCKNNYEVKLLSDKELQDTNRRLYELSEVIGSNDLLKERYNTYAERYASSMLKLMPCLNKWQRAALKLGFPIKCFVPTERLRAFENILKCEAYYNLFKNAVRKHLKYNE